MASAPDAILRPLLDFTFAVEFFCGTAANCLVLHVFYRKPGLLTVANRFVVNLTIINIICCVTLLPLAITDNTSETFIVAAPYLCYTSQFISYFCSSIIPFSVLLIAIDQYFAVVDPLHYHGVINNLRSAWMIVTVWTFSLLLSVGGIVQFFMGDHREGMFNVCSSLIVASNSTTHHLGMIHNEAWQPLFFSLTFVAISFVLPFLLICFIYSRICAAASGNTKRTQPLGHKPLRESVLSCADASKVVEQDEDDWEDEDVGIEICVKPTVVLTRPSPPPADMEIPKRTYKSSLDISDKEHAVVLEERIVTVNRSLPNLKVGKLSFSDVSLLKPFLPRNTSFCVPDTSPKLAPPQRRHSNVPITITCSDMLPKPGSLYKHSSATNSSPSSSTRIPVSRASSIRSTSSFLVSNIRHRLSNAGLFRYRERARVARVSALVIVMALLCWLPFFAVHLVHASVEVTGVRIVDIPCVINTGAMALLLISTVTSPALFAFRNRKIRKEIRNIFKFKTNDFNHCSRGFSRQHFLPRLKEQILQLVSKVKPINFHKNATTAVPVKLSSPQS